MSSGTEETALTTQTPETSRAASRGPTRLEKLSHAIGSVVVVLIFAGAAWLLYHELKHYRVRDIRYGLSMIPAGRVWLAVGLTALNYLILIGYYFLAVRSIRHPLALGRVALASFTGFATSYNFGALLGGTSVRYRLYSVWGLSAVDIVRLVLMLGLTFWFGIFGLASVLFLIDPFPIPAELNLPFATVRPLGWGLLVLTVGYLGLTAFWKKPIRFRSTQISLPGPGISALQLAIAAADLIVAAAILYVLLPPGFGLNYFEFLGIYLLAVVAVILTHVPGGVGVFELMVLKLAGAQSNEQLVAALLIFRAVYYLLPLLISAVLLAGHELMLRRRATERLLEGLYDAAGAALPSLLAYAAFAAGAILLFSGALPVLPSRLGQLAQLIPLPLMELSHFLASLAGTGLLLAARGLQRRLDSAWRLTIGLLAVGIAGSLLKGFDYEEAIVLAVVLAVVAACRQECYHQGSLVHLRFTTGWMTAVVLAVLASVWLGLFAYRHIDDLAGVWSHFALRADAPRFLRASLGVVFLLLFVVVRRTARRRPWEAVSEPEADWDTVAAIVRNSPQTTANLALLGDKSFLLSEQRNAFVMYAVQGRSWVALGDPVGPDDQRIDLVWNYLELVERADGWPVFYQVDQQHLPLYLEEGLDMLKLGEEARVPLEQFALDARERDGLRQTHETVRREHCRFEMLPPDPLSGFLAELQGISDAWLAHRQMAEKRFALASFDAEYLSRFPCAIVRQSGRVIAFANVWAGAGRAELSADLIRYRPGAPPGLVEYLLVELMLWGRQEGYRWFNLGMGPLAGMEDQPLAPLWTRTAGLTFRHGGHFSSLAELRQFKDKFAPVWQAKYLVSPGGLALPRIIADVATLIAGKPPGPAPK